MSYREMMPRGQRFTTELLFDMGGGGSGGGQTTQTQATMKPWAEYVPPETYTAYAQALKEVGKKYNVGLEPEEKAQYTGQIMSNTANQFQGAQKDLTENLARSGVKGGARAEAITDLNRSKAVSGAVGLSNLTSQDIAKKQQNLDTIRRFIALPSSPIQTGSTSTTTQSGGGGGS